MLQRCMSSYKFNLMQKFAEKQKDTIANAVLFQVDLQNNNIKRETQIVNMQRVNQTDRRLVDSSILKEDGDLRDYLDQKSDQNNVAHTLLDRWFKGGAKDEIKQDDIDYDLKKNEQNDEDELGLEAADSSDFEDPDDFWGVEREGRKSEDDKRNSDEDDDDSDGGEMMPILNTV